MDLKAMMSGFDAEDFFGPTLTKIALFVVVSFLLIAFYAYDLYCPAKTPPNQFASECFLQFNGYWRILGFIVGSYIIASVVSFGYKYFFKKEAP